MSNNKNVMYESYTKAQLLRRYVNTKASLLAAYAVIGKPVPQKQTVQSLQSHLSRQDILNVLAKRRATPTYSAAAAAASSSSSSSVHSKQSGQSQSKSYSQSQKRSGRPSTRTGDDSSSVSARTRSRSRSRSRGRMSVMSTKGAGGGGGGGGGAQENKGKKRSRALYEQENVPWRTYSTVWRDFDRKGEIASGSFGTVLLVERKSDGTQLALKVLKQGWGADALEDDIRAMHALVSVGIGIGGNADIMCPAHVVCYEDHFLTPQKEHALLMRLVPGQDMFRYVVAQREKNPHWRPSPAQARAVLKSILHGVKYLHDQGRMAHRDLKPENVILNEAGTKATVIDLGLACFTGPGAKKQRCDDTRTLGYGTPCYTYSPEHYDMVDHARADNAKMLAGDVWAIGMLMMFFLSGDDAQRICDLQHSLRSSEGWSPTEIERELRRAITAYSPPASFYPEDKQIEAVVRSFFEAYSKRPTVSQALSTLR